MERRSLCEEKIFPLEGQVAVHFVRRDLMETADAIEAARVEEHARAHDIRLEEDARIRDGPVHMALRGEIHHHVGLFFFKQPIDEVPVRDVPLHKGKARLLPDGGERLQIARIGELIQTDDLVVRMGQLVIDEIAPDKSGSAGDDNLHGISSEYRLDVFQKGMFRIFLR